MSAQDTPRALLLAAVPCSQCLTSKQRIVSGSRAADIIKHCRQKDVHFTCHKGSTVGQDIHCRGVHDIMGGDRLYRMTKTFGLPVREVDTDAMMAERAKGQP
jgi:hypothetical protein